MTPILLFVATYGHDERCGWCVVVVEPEGMFEEHQGVASNTHRAMLWALYTAFRGISRGEKVGIRSLMRPIIHFEKAYTAYQTEGWEHDDHKDMLDLLIPKMMDCEIKFVDANTYPQAGDSRAKKLAQKAHESYSFSFPEEEISFLSSTIDIINPFLSSSSDSSLKKQEKEQSFPNLISPNSNKSVQPEITPQIEEEMSTARQRKQQQPDISCEIENNVTTTKMEEDQPNLNPTIDDQKNQSIPKNISEDNLDTSRIPVEFPPSSEYLFGARILAYVDGVGNGTLGAWSFVLIDRQTGWALLRAKGVTATTSNRMKLQACIEALHCLKEQSQTVEIRSRYRNLIQTGKSWMDNWKSNDWKKSNQEEVSDLSFLVELDELRTQHKLSWQYIPLDSDEQGIKEVTRLSKNALHNLNYGEFTDIESRIKNYPLHHII